MNSYHRKNYVFLLICNLLATLLLVNNQHATGQLPSRDLFNFVFENDFNDDQQGAYTNADYISDWKLQRGSLLSYDINILQEDDANYQNYMQGYFPMGSFSDVNSGWHWETNLSSPVTELYFSYSIRFKPGFEWVHGGKMPGLQGGNVDAGSYITEDAGFSARPMWSDGGRIVFYVYHQDMEGNYGDSWGWGDFTFSTGKWYTVTERVVLNTIDEDGTALNDGILEGFIDGELMFQRTNIKFKSKESINIESLSIASFFGGSSDFFAATRDEWIDVDNFVAYSYSDKVQDVPRDHDPSSASSILLHPYIDCPAPPVLQVPEAPSQFASTAQTKNSITLSWVDNATNEQGFSIWRSSNSSENFIEIAKPSANKTIFTDKNLTPSTTYYYQIRAFNGAGVSEFSSVISATTRALELPAAPTGLIASHIDYESATLIWKDNASNETGFELLRMLSVNNSEVYQVIIPAGTTSFTDTTLTMNTSYLYQIRTRNNDGSSAWSNTITVVTPRLLPPTAPTKLKSTKFTDKSISVTWDDNSNNEEAFVITRSLATDLAKKVDMKINANDTAFTDTCLISSTTYQYTIKAINKGGSSSSSNKNVATTLSLAELKRVKDGLVAYYNFGYNPDYIVYDQSGYGDPVNLNILDRSSIKWNVDNTLDIFSNSAIVSLEPAKKIVQAIKKTNEITFECWLKPVEPNFGMGSRIASLSTNDNELGFAIDQNIVENFDSKELTYHVRMQTASTIISGYPEFIPDLSQSHIDLQHIVYTRTNNGQETLYLNGKKSTNGFRPSEMTTWKENYYLRLGNESDMNHSWKGSYYSVAFYNKALSESEIIKNYSAGPCDSIQNSPITYTMDVFPNPTHDLVKLRLSPEQITDIVPQTIIRVLDIFGKVTYERFLFNPNKQLTEELDFSNYSSGFYIIQVISGNKQQSTKIMVQK